MRREGRGGAILAMVFAAGAFAASAGPEGATPTPESEAKAGAPRLSGRHQIFLEDDAAALLSDFERQVFLSLPDDRSRDAFVLGFWEARNPTPGSARNDFRLDHRKRVAEADRLFSEGRRSAPGSRTPRGRLYVLLGPPRDRIVYAASAPLRDIEDWSYQSPPGAGLPASFHVLFYRRGGATSPFEIYDPNVDGPQALVVESDPGSGAPLGRAEALRSLAQASQELAALSLSLVPSDALAESDPGRASVGSERLAARLRDLPNRRLVDVAYVDSLLQAGKKPDVGASFRQLPVRAYFQGAFAPSGEGVAHYVVEMPTEALSLAQDGDRHSATLHVAGTVFTTGGAPVASIDETVDVALGAAEYAAVKVHPFAFVDVFPLLPGAYRASLVVRNLATGELGAAAGRLEVPAPAAGGLALGPLLLTSQSVAAAAAAPRELRPFLFGARRVYPSHGGVRRKGELEVTFQVAYPETRHAAGTPLEVRYTVLDGKPGSSGEERLAGFDRVTLDPAGDRGIATGSIRVSMRDLAEGAYTLRVSVSGGAAERAEREAPFVVAPGVTFESPWVYARKRSLAPADFKLTQAGQWLARGDESGAIRALEAAMAEPRAEAEARLRLAALRLGRKEFGEAAQAVEPLVAAASGGAGAGLRVQAFAAMAAARAGAGDHACAISAYERALAHSPRSTRLLNELAGEYARAREREQARATLERSLEIDPEQPRARATLRELGE